MRTALDELSVEDCADYAVTLEVRVGIDAGDVVVSMLGRGRYTGAARRRLPG